MNTSTILQFERERPRRTRVFWKVGDAARRYAWGCHISGFHPDAPGLRINLRATGLVNYSHGSRKISITHNAYNIYVLVG